MVSNSIAMLIFLVLNFVTLGYAIPQEYQNQAGYSFLKNYSDQQQLTRFDPSPQFIPNGGANSFNAPIYNSPYYYNNPDSARIITKDVYVHVAPEEPEESLQHTVNLGPRRKHYKIIFVKPPSQSRKQVITLAQPPTEEKTLIYVLSKKNDASDSEISVQPAPIKPSKPEVFFIKYKTPEEAAFAQKQIQAQYDSLGGSTEVAKEEISPVASIVGSLEEAKQEIFQLSSNSDNKNSEPNTLSTNGQESRQYLLPVR